MRRVPQGQQPEPLAQVAAAARACQVCAAHLPLGPRPVFRASATARLLIVGQAPGTRVHATGIPWNDPSGERLRSWLQLDRDAFYDESRIAIVPMGLCYPGRLPQGGDAPPRRECAPLWRDRLVAAMPDIRLTLLVGTYAQVPHPGAGRDDRPGAAVPRLPAAVLPAAASVLAHRRVGAPASAGSARRCCRRCGRPCAGPSREAPLLLTAPVRPPRRFAGGQRQRHAGEISPIEAGISHAGRTSSGTASPTTSSPSGGRR